MNKSVKLTVIMNNHVGRKYACGWESGNNEFSWSDLIAYF